MILEDVTGMAIPSTDLSGRAGFLAMPQVAYDAEIDPRVQSKVRARFGRVTRELADLGFRELCFYHERFKLFSQLLSLPTFLLMWAYREVVRFHTGSEGKASFILMRHDEPATVAAPLRLGLKLYTGFTDGTLLISTSWLSCALAREGSGVIKDTGKRTVAETWAHHQHRVRGMELAGKEVTPSNDLEQYLEWSKLEDAATVCQVY